MHSIRHLSLFLLLFASILHTHASEYQEIYQALSKHQHRLPGSTGYTQSANTLLNVFKKHGLETGVQSYFTLVPETTECTFILNGRKIDGVFAVQPNLNFPTTTHGKTITGELIYISSAALRSLKNMDLSGKIAVVELGNVDSSILYTLGAQALIFVDNPHKTPSQWHTHHHHIEAPMALPRAYIPPETAKELQLDSITQATASLKISSKWKRVEAKNLYVRVPSQNSDAKTIILSAHYDTFGFVPELCPQNRLAANAALLADTVLKLKQQTLNKHVVAVFLGSSYSAQEGSRYVHWCGLRNNNQKYFKQRDKDYSTDLDYHTKLLTFLNNDNFLVDYKHPFYRTALKQYRQILDKRKRQLEYDIMKAIKASAPEDRLQQIRTEKDRWSDLLGDVMTQGSDATVLTIPAERQDLHQFIVKEIKSRYSNLLSEIKQLQLHNASHATLSTIFGDNGICLHLAFDFANDQDPWVFNFTGDHSVHYSKAPIDLVHYKSHIKNLLHTFTESAAHDTIPAPLNYDVNSIKPESFSTPFKRSLASAAALSVGVYGYNLCTVGDALHLDNLPHTQNVDLQRLSDGLSPFIRNISQNDFYDKPLSSQRYKTAKSMVYTGHGEDRKGIHISTLSGNRGESIEGPASNFLVSYHYTKNIPNYEAGHSNYSISMVDSLGYAFDPLLIRRDYWETPIATGMQFNEHGTITHIGTTNVTGSKHIKAFPCVGGGFIVPIFPTNYENFLGTKFYLGSNNANLASQSNYSSNSNNAIVLYFSGLQNNVKIVNKSGIVTLGSTKTEPTGHGTNVDHSSPINTDLLFNTGKDLQTLNESRLQTFREQNIVLDDLENFNAIAKDNLTEAETAKQSGDVRQYLAKSHLAATYSNHAYQPLIKSSNDMIFSVSLLLLLSIPFAFSLERLLISATIIYKQVFGFIFFFLLTFASLYMVHPAFSLANSPVIIFLAFIIILMSGFVIYIIMGKFEREVLALQGLKSATTMDTQGRSTFLASAVIGISTMRNRPLKTFLTILTIVFLTFTILVFSSFNSQLGVSQTFLKHDLSENRIEIKQPSYLELPPQLMHTIEELYADRYEVFSRATLCYYPYDKKIDKRECVIYCPKTNQSTKISAGLGFDPRELTYNKQLQDVIPRSDIETESPIYLPHDIAEKIGAEPGDQVKVYGKSFTYVGAFNSQKLKGMNHLDGTRLLPPDYEMLMGRHIWLETAGPEYTSMMLASLDVSNLRWVPGDNVAVMHLDDVLDIRGFKHTTVLYPHAEEVNISEDANLIAEFFNAPVYAKDNDGVSKYFFTETFSGSGYKDILIPLLLGGLIIFSSLLGSIVDREKEIFTFSALGLSPPSVAALFFAESSVYAVLGGLGGYLAGQVIATGLGALSDLGLFHVPDMNFSSLNSTYTILLVMGVVLLSTIYPAHKASKSANPGVARKWKMPQPEGDYLNFVFPFTVAAHDLNGILQFIAQHFNNHQDSTLGLFAASDVSINHDGQRHELHAKISLAPFDLGIFQHFCITSQESEIPNILEVVVSLERLSGSPSSWIRYNRRFINDLRNQFLVWRSLPAETIAKFSHLAQEQAKIES